MNNGDVFSPQAFNTASTDEITALSAPTERAVYSLRSLWFNFFVILSDSEGSLHFEYDSSLRSE